MINGVFPSGGAAGLREITAQKCRGDNSDKSTMAALVSAEITSPWQDGGETQG